MTARCDYCAQLSRGMATAPVTVRRILEEIREEHRAAHDRAALLSLELRERTAA